LFLEKPLGRIIHLQTYGKEGWTIFELMELQEALTDSQLLMVEVQASDQSCHFVFVGPSRPNTLFILKEGSHFHGIKDPITFFSKYCDFSKKTRKLASKRPWWGGQEKTPRAERKRARRQGQGQRTWQASERQRAKEAQRLGLEKTHTQKKKTRPKRDLGLAAAPGNS